MQGDEVVLVDVYAHVFTGAQRSGLAVLEAMAAGGRPVRCCTTAPGPLADNLGAAGVPVTLVRLPGAASRYGRTTTGLKAVLFVVTLPVTWLRFARAFGRPAAVHVHDHRGMLVAAVPARIRRARVVWHAHSLQPSRLLNRLCGALAQRVVVPTELVLDRLPGLEGRLRRRVRILPNPVDAACFAVEREVEDRPPRLVTAGRVHPDKGLDVLVDALPDVLAAHAGTVVEVYGGPQAGYEGLRDELTARAEALGVAQAIDFVGSVPEPWRRWTAAACYVQPSYERSELQPIAVLEAMAVGLPVVATAVGGVPELVDERSGRLVPPGRPEELAKAIVDVLDDDDRAELGAAGRRRARERHSPEVFGESVRRLYAELGL